MNENVLEKLYQERLEERIINRISEIQNISLEQAMDIYYSSNLSREINQGTYGIQYMDYKILAELICRK
ncbi:MAG: hypothetical protein MJZ25_00505 [Fibrobacter sp.]|nr:hypothetical protein [Fibrobacter sp.]